MRRALARLRYFFREAAVNLARARAVNALTIGIIGASLFILGGFLLLVSNLEAGVAAWNRVAINVYLRDEAPASEVARLRERLASEGTVREVRHVTREEAAAVFRERFAHLAAAAEEVGGNPFPASLEVIARGERAGRLEATERLLAELRSHPIVEEVRDNEEEARRVLAVIAVIAAGGWVVGGILGLASLFTIFNVIRLTVYQRRDEVAILRLIGATGGFIRGPFLVEGTLHGLAGALAALGLLLAAYGRLEAAAASTGNPFLKLLAAGFLSPAQAAGLALAGTVLGAAGSLLSLRRFLAE
jgi:cell division transport system permease protein